MDKVIQKIAYLLEMEEFKRTHTMKFDVLSPREKEIFILTTNGKEAPEIAELLGISRNTINNHRRNIIQKLEIKGEKDIINYGIAFDLLEF